MTTDTKGANERRAGHRVAVNFPVRLILEPDGERREHAALLIDASEWGVCLVTGSEVSMGQSVEVIPQEGAEFAVHGRVVWIASFHLRSENHLGIQLNRPQSVQSWKS